MYLSRLLRVNPLITRNLRNKQFFPIYSNRLITTLTPDHAHHKNNRPLSPHVSIYQPQLTWIMSIGHRITGAGLAGLIYGFGITSSFNTINMTTKLCEIISSIPLPVVLAGKFILAAPFAYHLLNGIRHLIWDTGRALTLKGVYVSGWIVNVATLISAGLLSII